MTPRRKREAPYRGNYYYRDGQKLSLVKVFDTFALYSARLCLPVFVRFQSAVLPPDGRRLYLSQQIFGPVDVVARVALQRMEYRNRAGAQVVEPDRTDRSRSYGAGVGYRFGQVRLGVNVDKQRRTSPIERHSYEGVKVGTSMTYGF